MQHPLPTTTPPRVASQSPANLVFYTQQQPQRKGNGWPRITFMKICNELSRGLHWILFLFVFSYGVTGGWHASGGATRTRYPVVRLPTERHVPIRDATDKCRHDAAGGRRSDSTTPALRAEARVM